jgi:pyruvate dehydrogenase E1 component beta subunit
VALGAAKKAQQESGTSVEVIDLRTIWPLDEAAIVASVEKTGRAVIVHEAPRAGGVGAEVIAIINEHCLYSLLKPIERVTGYDTPFPVPGQEDYYVPTPAKVLDAIKRVMEP